ncbi:MAG: thioredoxin fold domain-containing protein [Bacteroidales bacterium]|nr:thioredoxin fold domain-containing protein [Bacteroidales bacterium]
MIKKLFLSVVALVLGCVAYAQVENPVQWSAKVENLGENLYEIVLTGTIEGEEWHIYDLGPYTDGPIATSLVVAGEGVKAVGSPYLKTEVHRAYDELFGMEIGTCATGVQIGQKVEVSGSAPVAKVTVEWQTCSEGSCLPPTDDILTVKLPAGTGAAASADEVAPVKKEGGKSIWAVILEAIAWGFVALLTPCVFPMVPMTVSFFLKSKDGKGKFYASMYGFFIVALYTLPIAVIILLTYILGGDAVTADIFNWLATHWIPNILFFIIFMVFAASFFGAFEITMPSWMVNKTDAKSDKGGLVGVFFMALTLVLVSFSCTGPIMSSVLIKSTQGDIWEPIITMFAFSAAFALPFTVFAFAPSLLKDLPKSGGWLNSVKVVLGFIEVALGLKFLSVADQVYQWNLLDREVYLAIWIVVFFLLGLYLLGKLRFAHDTPEQYISVKRLFLAIIVFSFVVYMIPGMWGAPLKALSGYLPPVESIDFNLAKQNVVYTQSGSEQHNVYPAKKFTQMGLKHIDGIPGFFDLQEALEYSKIVNKPVFIDYTGAACVNCREMEAVVFSDSKIRELLNNKFVFVSLYGDVKTEVPQEDWVTLPNGKVLKALGKINTNFIMEKYKVNAMPYYIIVDANGNEIVPARGYNLDKEAFEQFLNNAVEVYATL